MTPVCQIVRACAGAVMLVALAPSVQAGPLENLERERARLIDTVLAPGMSVDERQREIARARHRLVDLERMTLRDRSLAGRNTPIVRKAFASYDLTFLVHASVEGGRGLVDHWLEQLGVTTESVMNARIGRR